MCAFRAPTTSLVVVGNWCDAGSDAGAETGQGAGNVVNVENTATVPWNVAEGFVIWHNRVRSALCTHPGSNRRHPGLAA